jgi:hypothetical protein
VRNVWANDASAIGDVDDDDVGRGGAMKCFESMARGPDGRRKVFEFCSIFRSEK